MLEALILSPFPFLLRKQQPLASSNTNRINKGFVGLSSL